MLNFYNKCFLLGHFPDAWKKGLVIFFRKKNKDLQLEKSYRPITLLPMLGKLFERLLKIRVMTLLRNISCLESVQFGFQERSTIDAVNFLKSKITESLLSKKYCGIV